MTAQQTAADEARARLLQDTKSDGHDAEALARRVGVAPLFTSLLRRACDPATLPFETTSELSDLEEPLGQTRALEAAQFAVAMTATGYNLYVLGPAGAGKHALISRLLKKEAADRPTPADICYVYNFDRPHQPRALLLPPGRGSALAADMKKLVDDLRVAIPSAFETEDYRARLEAIQEDFKQRHESAFREVEQEGEKASIVVIRTPSGVVFAPTRGDEVVAPEEFSKLPEEEQRRVRETVSRLQARLQEALKKLPKWAKESREKVRQLNREVTLSAVEHTLDEVRERYVDLPAVCDYLAAVRADVIENTAEFKKSEGEQNVLLTESRPFDHYAINVIVDHCRDQGAPVVYEDHPGFEQLVGRIDHRARLGALVTDFTLIKAGALHRASGGYLIVDAQKLLTQPYAWEGLKRALFSRQVRIEPLAQLLGVSSTASLEPEPTPLDVKVVLMGSRRVYYLLSALDAEFAALFKVEADFEEFVDRTVASELLFARSIATMARDLKVRPLDRSAVAGFIEESSREAGEAHKLSVLRSSQVDLLREADQWAAARGADVCAAADVRKALEARVKRRDRARDRMQEAIVRGTLLIDTAGDKVGQVNGLSVLTLGDFAFGRPTRITATARMGEGGVVDIEREVELGGALHSKGVLILSHYLAARYARGYPLSLTASVVFEQSYTGVEGDSASLAELCALLSSLAGVPVRQSIAVTGSVNQLGDVQAVGGVNEKVEGFFDLCHERGLTGEHGVIIPAANVRHLMLRSDVVRAAADGLFNIYPVETADQAMEVLTGLSAGVPDEEGQLPEGSVNRRVAEQLFEFAAVSKGFGQLVKLEQPNGTEAAEKSS